MKKNFIFAFKANDLVSTKTFSSVIPCSDYNYFFNVLLPNPNIEKLASVYSIQNTLISIHRTKISSKHLYTVFKWKELGGFFVIFGFQDEIRFEKLFTIILTITLEKSFKVSR